MAKKKTKKKAAKKKASRPSAGAGSATPAKKKTKKKAASKKAPATKKSPAKKTAAKKAPVKKAPTKKPMAEAKPEAAAPTPSPADSDAERKKAPRKGITIVSPKPAKKPSKKPGALTMPELGGGILGPGAKRRKPLIPSGGPGPSNAVTETDDQPRKKRKSPFTKRQLDRFRTLLLTKRTELIGDVSQFEDEALHGGGGGESHLPQHLAEQGSDVADQSLNLDLAAADRRLIREIDAALERIRDGVFGLCASTGEPIGRERLEELPWARYSIEAAREIERRGRP